MIRFDVVKLDQELRAAGVPIHGVSGSNVGRIDFRPEATEADKASAAAILEAHDPAPTYDAERRNEYPPTDAMVVALWERIVEGRPEAAAALQAQREGVKAKYPKPSGSKP